MADRDPTPAPRGVEAAQATPLLVLASASPARALLLRSAGVEPVVVPSRVDEDALLASAAESVRTDARALTQLLARAKAAEVADRIRAARGPGMGPGAAAIPADGAPEVLVVGADSMLALGQEVYGKATSPRQVRERWAAMAGGTGVLVTGHTVVHLPSGRTVEASVATTIHFGRPDPIELDAYIASGEPLAVAGSCTIDGLGGPFIDGIQGDHSNVIGLALPTLRRLLSDLGIRWTDLWSRSDG